MLSHALHSPNLPQIELDAYLRVKGPARHRRSLIEISRHDINLLRFIDGPMTAELLQEVVSVVESVVDVPNSGPSPPLFSAPLATTFERSTPLGIQIQTVNFPPHQRINFGPLWAFIVNIIDTVHMGPPQIVHAIIMLKRLKEALPHLPDDQLSTLGISRDPRSESGFVALPCSHHRIALTILMTTHKYLIEDPFKYQGGWHAITVGIFDKEDILAMEVQFLLRIIGFDLFISEQDIIDRFYVLIYPADDRLPPFHPDDDLEHGDVSEAAPSASTTATGEADSTSDTLDVTGAGVIYSIPPSQASWDLAQALLDSVTPPLTPPLTPVD